MAREEKEIIETAESFEHLFRKWYKPLCRTAFRYLYSEEAAEDVVQDVFTKLWQRKKPLIFEYSAKSYLYRAVINGCLNYLEKNKRSTTLSLDDRKLEEKGRSFTKETLLYNEAEQQVNNAINELPSACRQVFLLNRFENLSNKEIASALNISVKTVENQMTKALKMLHTKLHSLLKNRYLFTLL